MFSIMSIRGCRDALLVLAIGLFGFAQADGPVSVANLPGGGGSVLLDTDITQGGGLGQRWGRAGGRTITYHVNNPATFSALKFGVTQGQAPSLQFDGFSTPQPSGTEIMTFNAGESNLASGMARWSGSATLVLVSATYANLPTRFTMTVTRVNGGTPVAIGPDPSGPNPLADVLASGDFNVNLLFEMADIANPSVFHPALDYYDSLATVPGNPPASNNGPVTTGVSTAFYYTLAVTGMTLEEHDAHLQALFDALNPTISNMNGKINFIRTDWDGRWNGIQQQVFDAQNSINGTLQNQISPTLSQIQNQVQQLVGSFGQGINLSGLATKDDVSGLKDMLMILWGLSPCPLPPDQCAQVKFIQNLSSQSSVDAVKADTAGILIGMNNANAGIGAANTKLDASSANLNTLASQSSVDGILIALNQPGWLAALQAQVSGILIGLNQPTWLPAVQSQLNALSAKVDALQGALDSVGSSQLDMIIGPVDTQGSKQARFIVKISRDGELVPAVITGVSTIRTAKGAGAFANVMGNTTIVTLAPGLYDVTINLVKDVSDGSLYLFEASSTAGGGTLFGNAMSAPFK